MIQFSVFLQQNDGKKNKAQETTKKEKELKAERDLELQHKHK